MNTRTFIAAISLAMPLVAHALEPREAGRAVVESYARGGSTAVLDAERACWRRLTPGTATEGTHVCGRLMLAGGLNEQAMQRYERRGANVAMTPQAQRVRFLEVTRRLGLSTKAADAALALAAAEIPQIIEGMVEAAQREDEARRR